jgi:hypothetical protein
MCRYTFPFESQALYTQDVAAESEAEFAEATFALHRTEVPAGTCMQEHFAHQGGLDGQHAGLTFELFDCVPDEDADTLVAVGTLPIPIILASADTEVLGDGQVRCPSRGCADRHGFQKGCKTAVLLV